MNTLLRAIVSFALLATLPACAFATALSGLVTDASNGLPLIGATINADDFFSNYHGFTTTGNDGRYQLDISGNPLLTVKHPGYVTQIEGAHGASTLDFALSKPGTIGGTVRSAGLGVGGASVLVTGAQAGNSIDDASTEPDGSYHLELPPGQYALCILDNGSGASIYADQCYDGQNVPAADGNMHFTTVTLASGQHISGIDFNLDASTSVSGTLRDSYLNMPIANKRMRLLFFSSTQDVVRSRAVTTDTNGGYTATGLTPADYYIVGEGLFLGDANSLYTPLVYGGAECTPSCTFTPTGLITVPPPGLSGVDFDLFPGRVIQGRVTDANTGVGIVGVAVEAGEPVCGGLGTSCVTGTTVTDSAGNYTLTHLFFQHGAHVATYRAPGYIDLLWPNTPCAPSDTCVLAPHDANSIDFSTPHQIVTGIDFALHRGASVAGRITMTEYPGVGVGDANVGIYFDDGQSGPRLIEQLVSDSNGAFSSDGWSPGTYYVAAWYAAPAPLFLSDCEFYGAIPCDPAQTPPNLSVPPGAQAIVISTTNVTNGVDVSIRVQDIFRADFE